MKLVVTGSIHERGNAAPFESVLENLASRIGERIRLPIPDTHLQLLEAQERAVRFLFLRFEEGDRLFLRLGETHEFTHEANAYGYRIKFELTE
ncbi:MAG: hypothetical protein J5736_04965 [Bacilli bacterium]|nr:hypothetical protein [Bacilli bacterium]